MSCRLSDFQVHEITLDGTVVHLISRTVPENEDEEDFQIDGVYKKYKLNSKIIKLINY